MSEQKLKPCPFCGEVVELEKRPLWRGSHGYHGCYEFVIQCQNCGCRINLDKNDTVYRSEDAARDNAIEAWNRRAADEH